MNSPERLAHRRQLRKALKQQLKPFSRSQRKLMLDESRKCGLFVPADLSNAMSPIIPNMKSPKRSLIVLSLLLASSLLFIGCAGFRNGSPPTKAEQALFTVTTNYTPTLITTTNPPAAPGQPPTVSILTSNIPTYSYSPGPAIQSAQGAASLIPGYGSLAGMGIGALAAVWAWIRSSKSGATAATLAQSIETLREFIQALPNGAVYDSALTTWLQKNQNQTNTVNQVLTILANDVSNPDAKAAAQQVIAAINALNPSALPPGTIVKV